MEKKKFTREWDYHAPLIFIEIAYVGDTIKMKKYLGFSYDFHYYESHNQLVTFYRNEESCKQARKVGYERYSDINFYKYFNQGSKVQEKKLIDLVNKLTKKYLDSKSNRQLLKIYNNFIDYYSSLVGFYRFCRPEYYKDVITDIKKNIPEFRDENFDLHLNDRFNNIDKNILGLLKNLKNIGKRRLEMHQVWLASFQGAEKLFAEIGKRIDLSSLETQNCTTKEINNFLLQKDAPDKEKIRARMKYYKLICHKNNFEIETKIKTISKLKRTVKIKGNIAYKGKVRGKVIFLTESIFGAEKEKMSKMSKGDIVVANMTSPDMMPAIRKAGAIITNEGGVLCHAAIIARELKIPCVVNTKIATQVLKDGDLVEVDANQGFIKILNKK